METTLFVFLIGSAATFLPVYWALEKGSALIGRWRGKLGRRARSPEMNEFLQCLRDEAASRVTTELVLALREVHWMNSVEGHSAAPLRALRMEQLRDVRRMMEPLFLRPDIANFDQITNMLAAGDIRQLDSIAAKIDALRARLMGKRDSAVGRHWLTKQRSAIALLPRKPNLARGWQSELRMASSS